MTHYLPSYDRIFVFLVDPFLEAGTMNVSDTSCAVAGGNKFTSLLVIRLQADAALNIIGRLQSWLGKIDFWYDGELDFTCQML